MKKKHLGCAPLTIRRGQRVELVRWRLAGEGWEYDLVAGNYRKRDRDSITLDVSGDVLVYRRGEWEVCAA